MTGWGYLIIVAAVFLGLNRSLNTRHRYAAACMIAVVAVLYAALRQHTY